jgi:peptidoglycan/LPS O-acetylase OafA/YrhL
MLSKTDKLAQAIDVIQVARRRLLWLSGISTGIMVAAIAVLVSCLHRFHPFGPGLWQIVVYVLAAVMLMGFVRGLLPGLIDAHQMKSRILPWLKQRLTQERQRSGVERGK